MNEKESNFIFKRILRVVGTGMAIGAVANTAAALGLEARRVYEGDFCKDTEHTQNLAVGVQKTQQDCTEEIFLGAIAVVSGIEAAGGLIIRKHTS